MGSLIGGREQQRRVGRGRGWARLGTFCARFLLSSLAVLPGVACRQSPDPGAEAEGSTETEGSTLSAGAESEDEFATDDSSTEDSEEASTAAIVDMGEACDPAPCEDCVCVDGELLCDCGGLGPEAGFIEIEPVNYALGVPGSFIAAGGDGEGVLELSSAQTRMFYAFQPADRGSDDGPLFVFFNGGPGVSSGMLLGLSTGSRTFSPGQTGTAPGDPTVVDNPASWTALGNLLWIDARHTGFSHGLIEPPAEVGDAATRGAAMNVASFNSYIDAADFVRTLLRFLAAHPSLADNPVVVVGESYGGTRAQVMLDMLLQPGAYAQGTRHLLDPALVAEIDAHHAQLWGPGAVEPAQISAQFGRQILIQPAMTGLTQKLAAGELFEAPDSPLHTLAAELGTTYTTCAEQGGVCSAYNHGLDFASNHGRSPYDTRAPASWLSDLLALVRVRLNDVASTEALLMVDVEAIVGLSADDRSYAWRSLSTGAFGADEDQGDWPELLGALEDWDRYFVPFHHEVLSRFNSNTAKILGVDPNDSHFGALFLSNLRWVDTMITVAQYDLVVYTPALPSTFETYFDPWVAGVEVQADEGWGERWRVDYQPGAFPDTPEITSREISVPHYPASHAVTLDTPELMRDDVQEWMED